MASKKMFKVSGGFYNIRALQRTLNQDHRRRRKKDTQGKLIFFKFYHPLAYKSGFDPDFSICDFIFEFIRFYLSEIDFSSGLRP